MKVIVAIVLIAVGVGAGVWLWQHKSTFLEPANSVPVGNVSGLTITARNMKFSPATITVEAGTTITFKNADSVSHTLTSDAFGLFDTGTIGPNQTATITAPNQIGNYTYHCSIHPSMKGTLVVQ